MANSDSNGIEISHGNNPYDLFPGYHPPAREERQDAYQRGLVSIDANALLDLYRFSERARKEYFRVLEVLRPRLFITHQAASEFYRNRLTVVESRLNAAEDKIREIKKPLDSVVERIREFANRYQIDEYERQRLIELVDNLFSDLTASIRGAGAYDLTSDQVKAATDSVLKRLELLLAGRVGDALNETAYRQAIAEAMRRKDARIPPGYADERKRAPEQQAGDYLIWQQLIDEARLHGRPVLFVTNEAKEDWILEGPSDQILGPRPELVLEMRREANVQLHMVSVVGLLREAPEYLGTTVSPSTIQEAELLPVRREVNSVYTSDAIEQFDKLPESDQTAIRSMLYRIGRRLAEAGTLEDLSDFPHLTVRGDAGAIQLRDSMLVHFHVEPASAEAIDLVVDRMGYYK